MEIFQRLYGPVKALWADFVEGARRGTRSHAKGIKIFLIFSLVAFLVIFAGLLRFTETPTFCGLCHQMSVYMESWRTSSHRDVACTKCHYEPGYLNHLKGKWVDGQVSLAYFISGKRPSRPHAEINDSSCLQAGCHKTDRLQGDMIYKNVAFSHGQHLGELRRGMRLRCTSCHAQLVQGLHLTVHETNCFICHYYKAGPKGEEECLSCAVGGCTSCHVEPKGDINVKGWNFNHRKYIAREVACEKCHLNVVQGDGHVPEGKCVQCHNEPAILTAKYTSQFMHKNHVTDHKIECADCHTPLRHEIGSILMLNQPSTLCDKCHVRDTHRMATELYRGSGGIGVPDSPSLMFATNVDCVACHRKSSESQAALHTTRYAERAIEEACVDCHGEGFDDTLRTWREILSKAEKETIQRISDTQKMLNDFEKTARRSELRKAQNLLNEARHNHSLVLLGKGVHNIEHAIKLLNVANKKSEQARAAVDKSYKPKEVRTQVTCTSLCHIGIGKRSVSFNEIKFSHETHTVGLELRCSDCHSPRETHGKTFMKNCAGCHHGKESKVACGECHIAVKKLIQGEGGIGVQGIPSNKLDVVECVDCHRGVSPKMKDTFNAVRKRCIECHDPSYGEMAIRWKNTYEEMLKRVAPKIEKVREEIERIDRRGGHTFVYRKLFGEAEVNFNLAKKGNGIHNLEYSEALLEAANNRLDEALKKLTQKK
jgi:nitrate/TMAO reductase-like tetraheme cytochrome c subunit